MSGIVTVAEIVQHVEFVHRQDALEYAELIGTQAATPPYLLPDEVMEAATAVLALPGSRKFGPRAVVVGNTVVTGLTRLFAVFVADCFPMRVFRTEPEAEVWLLQKLNTSNMTP